ncbi:hypothetical protein ACQCT3_00895 [Sutcliffiella horikoshii]|uniref:hypothetical protein n=1 Tax=Sutcliffiella horikoshii TaxID=79883 RepID=UPI003CF7BCAB
MKFDIKNFVLLEVGEQKEGKAMVQQQIDFEELQAKTSAEFVKTVNRHLNRYNRVMMNSGEIRILTKEQGSGYKVLIATHGTISVLEYRIITGEIYEDNVATVDIRLFFDIPFGLKKLKEVNSCQNT